MNFEEADKLCSRITDFLISCGGPYQELNAEVQANVLHALATGQYVIKEDGDKIAYFASFWMVYPHEVATTAQRIKPAELVKGTVCYITEAAVGGDHSMREMIKDIRCTRSNIEGVFWHRPAKEDRVYIFPRQKGGDYGQQH